MDVESVFASLILEQLKARNAIEATYTGVFADYQALLRTNRELQVLTMPQRLFKSCICYCKYCNKYLILIAALYNSQHELAAAFSSDECDLLQFSFEPCMHLSH